MGRTRLVAHDTDDDTSSSEGSDMETFLTDLGPLRLSRLRSASSRQAEQASTSGTTTLALGPSSSRSNGLRQRRRVAESRSNSSTNSASNSPVQFGPTSPKLPRLSNSTSSLFSPRNRTIILSDTSTSPSPLFNRRGRNRRPAVESDEEQRGANMNTGTTAGGDEEGANRDGRLRRRATRLWASTTGRRPNAATSSGDRRGNRQQQVDADEAYARRLQAQYDAQFQAEQQQRRRREAVALRRQNRAQANSFRPLTPPLPPRMRDFVEVLDDDDEEDEDSFHVRLAIANILGETDNTHDDNLYRRPQRRGSPSGPTTLATVRRYYREAHLDANLFPDINISAMDFEALLELADEIGDASPSMSATEISRLPTSVYRQSISSVELVDRAESSSASSSSGSTNCSDETPTCAICMEKFSDGDVQRNLPCFHAFHKNCVDVWLKQKSSCPVCRVDARRTSPLQSP